MIYYNQSEISEFPKKMDCCMGKVRDFSLLAGTVKEQKQFLKRSPLYISEKMLLEKINIIFIMTIYNLLKTLASVETGIFSQRKPFSDEQCIALLLLYYAPCDRRIDIICLFFVKESGVSFPEFFALISALCKIRSSIISLLLESAAKCRGVDRLEFFELISAPCKIRTSNVSLKPLIAAIWSGVLPSLFFTLTFAPLIIRNSTISLPFLTAAK